MDTLGTDLIPDPKGKRLKLWIYRPEPDQITITRWLATMAEGMQ
jgi:hypothetical protein